MTQKKQKGKDPLEQIKADIASLTQRDSGVRFLRHLMKSCGYQRWSVVENRQTGEVNVHATLHNEALRTIWLSIRQLIPKDKLALIELEEDQAEPVNAKDNAQEAGDEE